jgi:Domain of Unknown Function (DUF928)
MSSKWHRQSLLIFKGAGSALAAIASLTMALPSQSLEFPPSTNRGAPARTAGGGVRGETCSAATKNAFTVLIPENNISTTAADSASLFFFVPEVRSQAAELLLMDEQGNDVYTMTVALPKTSGIIRVSLPEKTEAGTPLIALNKDYTWRFAIVCDEKDRTRDLPLDGTVRRVSLKPDVQAALQKTKADPLKQAEVYAKAGIWQETLVTAAALRKQNPQAWAGLMRSVKLEPLANAKFADCCKPAN